MYLCLSICLSLCLLCVELFSNIFWLNWSSPTTSSLSVSVCLLLTFYFFVSLFIAPSVFLSVPLSLSLSLPLCFSISLRASVSLHHKTLKIFFQRIPLKKYFLLQSSWHQSHFSLVTRFSQCHNWKWWYCNFFVTTWLFQRFAKSLVLVTSVVVSLFIQSKPITTKKV